MRRLRCFSASSKLAVSRPPSTAGEYHRRPGEIGNGQTARPMSFQFEQPGEKINWRVAKNEIWYREFHRGPILAAKTKPRDGVEIRALPVRSSTNRFSLTLAASTRADVSRRA